MRNYKSATFQPTIRPDWAGILSYISEKEKAEILVAIIKYPSVECDSAFWQETIKPDLDNQYQNFKESCEAKSRGIRERWGKISITDVEHMNKISTTYVIDAERERERKSESGDGREEEGGSGRVQKIIQKTAAELTNDGHSMLITPTTEFPDNDFFNAYRTQMPTATTKAQSWIRKSKLLGKRITYHKIGEIIQKFNKNQKNT